MSPISTIDLLIKLDFKYGANPAFSNDSALTYNFGNGYICATQTLNDRFEDVMALQGYYIGSRAAGEIVSEMPLQVESFYQGIAYLANAVGKYAELKKKPIWYTEGLKHLEELPHRRKLAAELEAYEKLPRCFIEHHWLKAIHKAMIQYIAAAGDDDLASFSFDGNILRIEFSGQLAVVPAQGKPWQGEATVSLKALKDFPRRIRRRGSILTIFEDRLALEGMVVTLINKPPTN
jgi:hypothetical protein